MNFVTVDMSELKEKVNQLHIVNIHGQIVFSTHEIENQTKFEILLSNISDGIYFVRIITDLQILNKKFSIIR